MSYSTMARAMISYVECHLEHFSLSEMSRCFGFSQIHLRALFLRHIGMPVMQYHRNRRILSSAFEILHSDKKIVDIALESGFSSHEAYTRAFRRLLGMSPSQFRRSRPSMGGTQLDTGVFGPNRLATKQKRSDVSMTDNSNDTTILYGIRRIQYGAYESSTMFPICIKAMSEYLGDDIPYSRIMAATGAAFRLVWNRREWDLSNIDIYHTLRESNDIYRYGAEALGRTFSFLGRDEGTEKETFIDYIRANLAKGRPVIALGIIGPPEPCIIAGYDGAEDAVMGWNFFQHDPEYASAVSTMDNGYFRTAAWWENTDTQALMCLGSQTSSPMSDREILRMAAAVMEPRAEGSYAKGLLAYDAWKEMLLDENWFRQSGCFDSLFSMLLVQNDAMGCLMDGRKWAAQYVQELARSRRSEASALLHMAEAFRRVSETAGQMASLIGDWNDTERALGNFADLSVREKLAALTDAAKKEDTRAYEQLLRVLETEEAD